MTTLLTKKNSRKVSDIKTAAGRSSFDETDGNAGSIIDYLSTGEARVCYGSTLLFKAQVRPDSAYCSEFMKSLAVLSDGRIYGLQWEVDGDDFFLSRLTDLKNDPCPGAVLVQSQKRGNYKHVALVNGDTEDNDDGDTRYPDYSLVDEFEKAKMPTVSFACLDRFYKEGGEMLRRLSRGDIKVLDFTVDERRKLTEKDKELLKKNKNKKNFDLKPPEPGFTRVGNEWHRSGTVLLHDKDRSLCIMVGQDEGTYFGVQLPKVCHTIGEAFGVLIPKEAVGVKHVRQGEWFMVPVDKDDVPEHSECLAISDEYMTLPKDSYDSNNHRISSDDIRVGKDGLIYAHTPSVEHEQHGSISGEGWQTFYKNTALQAFSQQGVD